MSLVFGLFAQLLGGRGTTRWMWSIGAGAFFVFGVLISEAAFGWATERDLQPNYDGLSFDETLLAIFPSVAVVIGARWCGIGPERLDRELRELRVPLPPVQVLYGWTFASIATAVDAGWLWYG